MNHDNAELIIGIEQVKWNAIVEEVQSKMNDALISCMNNVNETSAMDNFFKGQYQMGDFIKNLKVLAYETLKGSKINGSEDLNEEEM